MRFSNLFPFSLDFQPHLPSTAPAPDRPPPLWVWTCRPSWNPPAASAARSTDERSLLGSLPNAGDSHWYSVITGSYYVYIYMGLPQNSGMDRPAVIQTYGTVWITCVLVWIGGMDRPVGSGYGSGLYILTRSHIYIRIYIYIIKLYIYICIV